MPTLNVALIGQGFMGRAHSNAYRQLRSFFTDVRFEPRMRLICGRDRATLERSAALWGWEEVSTDWRAAVSRADIDLVDVATPNAQHAEMALAAAEAGKIVFCEKPLAISLEEAERMAAAARNVRSMVWFNYRRVPAVAYARQLIGEGRLGEIYQYRATYLQDWATRPRTSGWKLDKAAAGSGVLGDLFSHVADLALFLNGPMREISAMLHTFTPGREIDDTTLALARFENGSIGTLEATRFASGYRNRNRFEVHGSRGMLAFDLERMNELEFVDASGPLNLQGPRTLLVTGPDQPYSGNFWKPGHVIGYEHTFIAALGDFLTALGNGEPFHPDFDDGVRVQRVLDAVTRSAGRGEWVAVE